jgi:hypothetical protein
MLGGKISCKMRTFVATEQTTLKRLGHWAEIRQPKEFIEISAGLATCFAFPMHEPSSWLTPQMIVLQELRKK